MRTKYLLAVCLIVFLCGSLIGYGLGSNGSTFTISQGIYPGAPDYTVWKEASTYYAKTAYGLIFSSTNASYIFETVIDEGNYVFVKGGEYYITNTIPLCSYLTIIGETIDDPVYGEYSLVTKFIRHSSLEGAIFTNANHTGGNWNIHLERFSIDGAKLNNTHISEWDGIWCDGPRRSRFIDLAVYRCHGSGINFNGSGSNENQLHRCSVRHNNGYGVKWTAQSDYHITDCEFGSNANFAGVLLSSSGAGTMRGCHLYLNYQGIKLYNCRRSRFVDNRINTNEKDGIKVEVDQAPDAKGSWADRNEFIGNSIYNNGQNGTSGWAGIAFEGDSGNNYYVEYNLVEGNIIWDDQTSKTQTFAVREIAPCDNNTIINNVVFGNNATEGGGLAIDVTGQNTVVKGNLGFPTENQGNATISDGGTITHGLYPVTPTTILVQTSVTNEFASVTARDSTTFTVAIKRYDGGAGTTQTIYWWVFYDQVP